jgi:diguanylate cyclase (GGDEF)-like protein
MKILVLGRGIKELSLIQKVLEKGGHEMILAEGIEQAWRLIEDGHARFVIADTDMEGVWSSDLIRRVRSSNLRTIYFLLFTSGDEDVAEADDTLHKPLSAPELKARVMIGQRFLSLGDSLSQARDQIENMAVYDGLTGLMNRGAFYRTAQGELERARRASLPLSLIALDIDNFRSLNETYGIETGDEVLKVISQTIREKSRPYDCIGRWTGDEFVVALPGVIGSDAEKIAERVIKGVRSTNITYKDKILNVHVSAGIASASRISAATEVEPLIQQARAAMARAKEEGGDQVNLTYV